MTFIIITEDPDTLMVKTMINKSGIVEGRRDSVILQIRFQRRLEKIFSVKGSTREKIK